MRVCQNEDCKLIQNRDRTGALNIGISVHSFTVYSKVEEFFFLFDGMTTEEKELTLHRRCLECE